MNEIKYGIIPVNPSLLRFPEPPEQDYLRDDNLNILTDDNGNFLLDDD